MPHQAYLPATEQHALPANTPKGRSEKIAADHRRSRMTLNGVLGAGFVLTDTALRVKAGESLPVSLGKSLLENAIWAAMPGGFFTALGVGLAAATPDLMHAANAVRTGLNAKKQAFSAPFVQNEAQNLMKMNDINRGMSARQEAAAIMSRHAYQARKAY